MAETITRDELAAAMKRGDVQVVNVLEREDSGRLRMIEGSVHIPLSELEQSLDQIDRDKDVVVYCANVACDASRMAAKLLDEKGYRVRAYEGGISEWFGAGMPTTFEGAPAH